MEKAYLDKIWLRSYPPDIPPEIEIPDKTVVDLFEAATEKWSKRTALIFYGKKISYKKLREKVDKLATALSDMGVKKGDRVALLLLNSPEHIVSLFAVLKIGGVITPVSPVYVSTEIKHQLVDSGAETMICQDILWEGVERTGLKLKNVILTNIGESLPAIKKMMGKGILKEVYQKMSLPSPEVIKGKGFHQMEELLKKYPATPPKVEINPKEDLVFLPYTGGTTGPPKGVMITHYNLVADLFLMKAFFPFHKEGKETMIAYMPFTHVSGQVGAVMDGIPFGYTLDVLASPDLDDIIRDMERYNATFFVGSPAIFEMLKDYENTNLARWDKLSIIRCAADILNISTAEGWESRTGIGLNEMYGMTETTAITHATPLGKIKVGSVGLPLCNTMSAILDPDKDEYLPVGEIGEIAMSSPQVGKGYWKNPEATRDIISVMDGIEWLRSGDLGLMDEDGYFVIYDRKRDLIKYKGYRIFAREVEDVLIKHDKIKEVGIVGEPNVKVGQIVKAMVVLESDARGSMSEADIIDYCKDKLTPYKIPKIIEFLGEIPKTDVGKVSRRELREDRTEVS